VKKGVEKFYWLLGKRWQIDCLKVKWPLLGCETQRFKDLPIDGYITIVEGEEKWK